MTLVLYILVRSQIQCTWINREKKIVKLKLDVQSRTLCYNKIIQDISQSWIYVFLTTDQPGITRDDKSIFYSYNSPEQELQIALIRYLFFDYNDKSWLFVLLFSKKTGFTHNLFWRQKKVFIFYFHQINVVFFKFLFCNKKQKQKKKMTVDKK